MQFNDWDCQKSDGRNEVREEGGAALRTLSVNDENRTMMGPRGGI